MDKYDYYKYAELNDKTIQDIKELAKNVYNGSENSDFNTMEMQLRNVISVHYNIPMFDDYFDKLTIAQLIFEAELIILRTMPQEQKDQNIMQSKEAKEELDHLFDDWDEEEKNVWTDMDLDDKMKEQMDESVQRFVNEGKFIGEE